ncbi:hypothetical protein GOBAR_AA18450 [Gossypium barbadense]|uniref:Uncharacterized protein n=1 Tax=Gossypium barbadense TaxID=3634 RepID=A0A2P5XFV2_GOSBA|nr:hypothetical protein GOBAR_AA18450 [Gossypium barbadense]
MAQHVPASTAPAIMSSLVSLTQSQFLGPYYGHGRGIGGPYNPALRLFQVNQVTFGFGSSTEFELSHQFAIHAGVSGFKPTRPASYSPLSSPYGPALFQPVGFSRFQLTAPPSANNFWSTHPTLMGLPCFPLLGRTHFLLGHLLLILPGLLSYLHFLLG